nr:methyl-accepting chemotaxis protein [Desulforamulus aquiferis]
MVAEEVRKLAEQSTNAAKEIHDLISVIQQESHKAVESMENTKIQAKDGVQVVHEVSESIGKIILSIQEMASEIQSLASATEQMASGVQNAAASTEEQTATMEELSGTSQDLAKMAEELDLMTKRFKLQ